MKNRVLGVTSFVLVVVGLLATICVFTFPQTIQNWGDPGVFATSAAALCLLGGLWMGAGDENLGLFLRWMGAALIFQGATLSALLFGR